MARREERTGLRDQVKAAQRALYAAQMGFEEAPDGSLTEYYLHAIHALRAKHAYLLRQLKSQEKEAQP